MKLDFSNLKVAIATDSMSSFGGADRLLLSLFELFPNAEVFTTVYNPKTYSFPNRVHTSFIQYIPFFKRHLSFLNPIAFEMFDLREFDLIISISAGPAKGVITGVNQPHISIINTPPRHQWEKELNARGSILQSLYKFASIFVTHYLRVWDISASMRSDSIISVANHIREKVAKIYKRESTVAYPGITKDWFEKPSQKDLERVRSKYNLENEYAIIVSRLFDHKRVDWAIKACMKAKFHLYVVGTGPDFKYLKKLSNGSKYIHFLGFVDEADLKPLYALASCFVFPAFEDYGYVTIEAMSQGIPVLCFNQGGSIEIVENGKSGIYFSNVEQLSESISKKAWKRYNPKEIIKRAMMFSQEEFLRIIKQEIQKVWKKR